MPLGRFTQLVTPKTFTPLKLRLQLRSTMSAASTKPVIPTTPPHPYPRPEDWPAAKVRSTYIDYFKNAPGFEHTFWPSSGVIPFDDDTLLFANAVGYSSSKISWILMLGNEPVQAPLLGNRRPEI